MRLELDRMLLDDVGANPQRLAAAIHTQLGPGTGPVPVYDIARALDIQEIRVEALTSFEGALVTTPERGFGRILVNGNRDARRQRFTIAHELGHFLSPWHRPTSPTGFWCNSRDLRGTTQAGSDQQRRQEGEANAFAIELLAPTSRLRRYLAADPNIRGALAIARELEISREAAVRRYVELHSEPLAVVFSREGRVAYVDAASAFPRHTISRNQTVPALPDTRPDESTSEVTEADAADWLAQPGRATLTLQTLRQRGGWAMTLLHVIAPDDDGDALQDSYERFIDRL